MEPTIYDFASKLPQNILQNESEDVLVASIAMRATITIKVQGIKNPEPSDAAMIVKYVQEFVNLQTFCEKNSLSSPKAEIPEVIGGFTTIIEIWLKPFKAPFTTDFLEDFHQDSSEAVILTAITLALKKEPLTKEAIIIKSVSLQKYGIPPVLSADAVRLQRPVVSTEQEYDPFARHVVSPLQRYPTTPSPVPFRDAVMHNMCVGAAAVQLPSTSSPELLVQIPEEEPVSTQVKNEGNFQFQGRQRRQIGAGPRQFFGVGPRPSSLPTGCSYNGESNERNYGVQDFKTFWMRGEEKSVPPQERFRKYTGFALKFHKELQGLSIDNPKVVEVMQKLLGEHFTDWNSYDWPKIDFKNPMPENLPMRSS